jgi:hypothetical protein
VSNQVMDICFGLWIISDLAKPYRPSVSLQMQNCNCRIRGPRSGGDCVESRFQECDSV